MRISLKALTLVVALAASLSACSNRPPQTPGPAGSTSAPSAPAAVPAQTLAPAPDPTTSRTTAATTPDPASARNLLDQLGTEASRAASVAGDDVAAASPGAESDPTS